MSIIERDPRRSTTSSKGVDKIEQYKWQVKDKKGEFAYVGKDRIHIDHQHYQRDNISDAKVLQMARDWSWIACGAISVARRPDGSLWAMDGQYRLMATLRRSDIKDLPCMIFDVVDVQEEAKGFLNVNTNRRAMQYLDRFKALITAGDEDAIFVRDLIESTNRTVGSGYKTDVRCVGALVSWARQNRDTLSRIWPILSILSPDHPVSQTLVDGLMFLEMAMPENISLSDTHHRRRLIQIGETELLLAARASAHFRGRGGAKIWADGILQRYNKSLQRKLMVREGELTF